MNFLKGILITILCVNLCIIAGTLVPAVFYVGVSLANSLERRIVNRCESKYDRFYSGAFNSRLFCPEKKGPSYEL